MNRYKKWLIETFGFKNQEAQTFLIFILFSFALFFSSLLPQTLFTKNDSHLNSEIHFRKVDHLKSEIVFSSNEWKFPSEIDPNKMDYYDWKKYKLDFSLINRIISYRLNGGYFKELNDLKKVYGMNDSLFSKLSNLKINKADFRSSAPKKKGAEQGKIEVLNEWETRPIKIQNISINSCDSIAIQALPGIGPVRSARIIKYRNLMGGFVSKDQFYNIYGMDSLSLSSLMKYAEIKHDDLVKIKINQIGLEDLSKHPLFNSRISRQIINYRMHHGYYASSSDLLKIKTLDTGFINNVQPYLSFE